jgi:hypothetical protein
MAKKNVPKQPSAIQQLRPSKLNQTQLELLGNDIDLSDLYLAFNHKDINIEEAVTDITVDRSIESSSTVTVEVLDRDRVLLTSGRLSARQDIEIDGLYFRLTAVRKTGPVIELSFEDREIALLRTYAKLIKQSGATARGSVTRAQFILRMIKEVKEVKIPWIIPELNIPQPIDGASQVLPTLQQTAQRGLGIPKVNDLMVKTKHMSEEQRKNVNMIINAGRSRIYPRPVIVMAIMCAIQESSITNLLPWPMGGGHASDTPGYNPVGVFQQIPWYNGNRTAWPASRDVTKDAIGFMSVCVGKYKADLHGHYGDIIESVQHSGNDGQKTYGQWKTQAERIVDAFGFTKDASTANNTQQGAIVGASNYEFYRGLPPNSVIRKQKYNGRWGHEDSWTAIQRLARDVAWRAFFVSGTFYYISEDDLFRAQPIAVVNEEVDGVISLDGNYDEYSKSADLTLQCQMDRWAAPPGSIVQITDMGPWDGRWLVNDISKSLFDPQGTITLKKPMPKLPEPSGGNLVKGQSQSLWTLKPKALKWQSGRGSSRTPVGDRTSLANELLTFHDLGQWRDDNGKGLDQIRRTAAGMMVSSQDPRVGQCYLQADVLRVVVWLIHQGWKVGTFAWCSDHSDDSNWALGGAHGHAGGWAVDISSLNGLAINQYTNQCYKNVYQVDTLLRNSNPPLLPRQLITGGYGNVRNMTLSAFCIPAADSFYGAKTMGEHCNHIHVGYGMRAADGHYAWPGA